MICKYCNGTGTSNTCVNGTFKPCAACNGTGEEIKEKITNFDRITASPEALAELIVDAMFLYSTNRHIFTIEAVKMASKKEKIDINLDYIYKDFVKWLNKECKE